MGPRANKPASVALTPWTLCVWRGETERCHFALVRFEQSPAGMAGAQAMFVDGTGCVAWRRYPAQWRTRNGETRSVLELAIASTVKTTVKEMMEYFVRRLLLVGGDAQAYEAMGVIRPILTTVEIEPDPKKNEELNSLYQRTAKLLLVDENDLREKYKHLNRGLQSMTLRNRLRAKGHNV